MKKLQFFILGIVFISVLGKTSKTDNNEDDDFDGLKVKNPTTKSVLAFNNVTGMVEIYNSSIDESKVTLTLKKLEERNADGKLVGEGDQTQFVHVVEEAEVRTWNMLGSEDCSLNESRNGNITASCITAIGTLAQPVGSSVTYMLSLASADGVLDLNGEHSPIKAGQVRVSVIIQGWTWCCEDNTTNCEKCLRDGDKEDLEIGSYLYVGLEVSSPANRLWHQADFAHNKTKTSIIGSRQFAAGKGSRFYLSSQVNKDGKFQRMMKGYPMTENKDSKTMLIFVCPLFTDMCRYDMIIAPSGGVECKSTFGLLIIMVSASLWHLS